MKHRNVVHSQHRQPSAGLFHTTTSDMTIKQTVCTESSTVQSDDSNSSSSDHHVDGGIEGAQGHHCRSRSGGRPIFTVARLSLLKDQLSSGFSSLSGSPPELYKAYILKFLDSYSYFSFSIVFTLFLSEDFGFSDVSAGAIYGAWGALITIYGVLTGFVVDNIGVSMSLKLGFAMSLLARIGIFVTTSSGTLLFHVLVSLPMANCLGIPVLTTGIRRYTDDGNRGFAFGLFYVVMNVAALISGPVVDVLTIRYRRDDTSTSTEREWSLTSYRAIILTGIIANFVACLVAWTVREIKVDQQPSSTLVPDDVVPPLASVPQSPRGVAAFRPRTGSPMKILGETLRAPSFRRFLVVCLITLNVRMIFRHLDATLPKYMVREFGDDVPKGTIYSINPLIIILLVPIVTASTSNIEPLVMIHFGSYISAISVFALAFSTSISACIVFVTVLSIGEAIWSPRLYDYSVSVCKEGREGTYMALSSAPLFLAKLPVGFLSGALLQRYCPEEGERNSQVMWLIIGLLTASSPVFMTFCWGYISKKDEEEDEDVNYTELNTLPTVG